MIELRPCTPSSTSDPRDLDDGLARHPAPSEGVRGLARALPRPLPADLGIEPPDGDEPEQRLDVRAEPRVARVDGEHLDAPAAAPPPLRLEVDRGRLPGRLPDRERD